VERTAAGTRERTLSFTNPYTKRQRIAELARAKSGVALSTLHHVLDLEWMKEAPTGSPARMLLPYRRCDGGRVCAKPGGQSFGPPGAHQVRPLSSAAGPVGVHSQG
jgi:hypothetical protein